MCGVGGRCRVECNVSADCPLGAYCLPGEDGVNGCSLPTDSCSDSCEGDLLCRDGRCLAACVLAEDCPDRVCEGEVCAPNDRSDAGTPADAGSDALLDAPTDAAPSCGNAPDAVRSISVGLGGTCVALSNGDAYCWGERGVLSSIVGLTECGGDCSSRPVPVRDAEGARLPEVVEVSAGGDLACARTVSGEVWCWHDGMAAERIRATSGPFLASAISVGRIHACAIEATTDALHCWGDNSRGQLGVPGRAASSQAVAVGVLGVSAVSTSSFRTMAITATEIVGFGENENAELGVPWSVTEAEPVTIGADGAMVIATGIANTCTLGGGIVHCWGAESMLMGSRDTTYVTCEGTSRCTTEMVEIPELTSIAGLAIDRFGTSAVAWTSGWVPLSWGTSHTMVLAEPNVEEPIGLGAIDDAVETVSIGNHAACAIVGASRQLLCWGLNTSGQLGRGYVSATESDARNARGAPICW